MRDYCEQSERRNPILEHSEFLTRLENVTLIKHENNISTLQLFGMLHVFEWDNLIKNTEKCKKKYFVERCRKKEIMYILKLVYKIYLFCKVIRKKK